MLSKLPIGELKKPKQLQGWKTLQTVSVLIVFWSGLVNASGDKCILMKQRID